VFLDTLDHELQAQFQPKQQPDEADWQPWLLNNFASHYTYAGETTDFSFFHAEFWDWVWSIRRGVRPKPFIAVWSRETGKSTNTELACIALGHRRVKAYVLYVSGTQAQANDHVGNIGNALETTRLSVSDPALCNRRIGKYGQSKGWGQSRLRTRSGLTVDAVGLDAMGRGAKLDTQRPDLIILDDIDKDHDSELLVMKKITTLTKKILPSGSPDLAILAVQNLVHANSVFARILDGRAEFFSGAIISGPHPAIKGLTYEKDADGIATITGGTATWENLSVERCQAIINDIGLTAFLAEYQHDKSAQQGAFFADIWIESVLVLDPFQIPPAWRIYRAFDYGFAKPFSVGWWALADGETNPPGHKYYPKGTLFRVHEWYGWNGKPNQGCRLNAKDIADKILDIEKRTPALKGRVRPGPADSSIWDGPINNSVATHMSSRGCFWHPVDKGPGSRINGARLFRERMQSSNKTPITQQGIFFFRTCDQIIRCLPQLPRDLSDPDDVNSDAEDHNYDEARYMIQWKPVSAKSGSTVGMY